jgi:hypothetical protein
MRSCVLVSTFVVVLHPVCQVAACGFVHYSFETSLMLCHHFGWLHGAASLAESSQQLLRHGRGLVATAYKLVELGAVLVGIAYLAGGHQGTEVHAGV